MIQELTRRFIEKVENEKVNLRKLEKLLGIPYDRMYKWRQGLSNPKPPDDKVVEKWINGNISNGSLEERPTSKPEHTEKLISYLEKRLLELEAREAHLKALNTNLSEKIKKDLENISEDHIEVKASLKTSIDNQLALTAMLEATIENLAQVLIAEPHKQLEFYGKIHREAFARQSALKKTGTHLEIRNNDIISH